MKASQFTDAQKAFIIKQGEDGTPVAEICRKAGISQATYFNWKKKYAGHDAVGDAAVAQLEQENARLKRIVADLTLDREMLQDVIKRIHKHNPTRSEVMTGRACFVSMQGNRSFTSERRTV